ncbi:hypothetical protein FRC12_004382 [Ceratobasidium sp. 428]|nr:hypothetical protein FRC12_004382 [Ceratobasidium sp. 428]
MDLNRRSPYVSSHSLHDSTRVNSVEDLATSDGAPKPEQVSPPRSTSFAPHRSPVAHRNTLRERANSRPLTPRASPMLILPPIEDPFQAAFRQKQNYAHNFADPLIRPLTWRYIKAMFYSVGMLIILMWAALPLYWGSLAPGQRHGPGFRVWVVDLDGGEMGAFVTESAINSTMNGTKRHLGWVIKPPMSLDEIALNQGATSSLQAARASGESTYDPTSAVTFYLNEARNNNAVGQLIVPLSTALLDDTMRRFNAKNIAKYIRSVSSNTTAINIALQSPVALSGAWWRTENLRPWNAPVATAMTVVGQIYISVFCFVLTLASFPVRGILEPYLTNRSVMLLRVLFPAVAYLPLSLSFAMLSLPFHAPFGTRYTYGGGFFVYFSFVYMDMLALGLAIEAAVTILEPRFMAYFLVCWLIINVSTPIDPHEMQVWWYKYGFAVPFFNHAEAVNTILFNTKNVLGRNAGILIAWIALSVCTTAGLTWLQRHEKVERYRAGIISRISSKAV